jgi:DNA-binding transcriptional regulator YbjK
MFLVLHDIVATVMTPSPTTPKGRALDAAIELLGTEGLRALTHARVDERASLPKGSTSNYFRTRAALLNGVSDWIVELEMRQVGPSEPPLSVDALIDTTVAVIEYSTGPNRVVTTARLVLFMEASHNPVIEQGIKRGREVIESWLVPTVAELGARNPRTAAAAMMAYSEGTILHRIARHDDTDPRPGLELVARGAFA